MIKCLVIMDIYIYNTFSITIFLLKIKTYKIEENTYAASS